MQVVKDYYRYCPGEERIKLSNAVCLGRRRSNYPKCKGCQFNDDQRPAPPGRAASDGSLKHGQEGSATSNGAKTAAPAAPAVRSRFEASEPAGPERIDEIFKAYDIRGTHPDPLNRDLAWRIGQAAAQFLRAELRGYDRSRPEKSAVVVGRDMRRSSPELAEALMDGLRTGGSPVIDIGMVDTPQLYFAVNHLTCCGGVQVTASHNPAQYNGFKICGQNGRPVSLETGLGKIARIVKNTTRHTITQQAPTRQEDLTQPYRAFVTGFLQREGGISDSRRLRVVVDASNGMAGRWFPLLLSGIDGLEATPLNFEHNGEFYHDPNPLVEANLAQLKDRVLRSRADIGVCFDGDADRCVFVDAAGEAVRADLVTALLARRFLEENGGSVVVYDLRSSRVVPEEIRKAGGVPRRERCGHAYIKKALADARGLFGGELSGHYYFRDNYYCDSAMIAFISVLNLMASARRPLHELIAPLKRYAQSGERNFENDDKEGTIKRLGDRYRGAAVDHLDGITVQYPDWWFNVRCSNTEPLLRLNIEANDQDLLEEKLAELCPLLGIPVAG